MERPANLVLVGAMGAGKSAIGRRLADALGLAFADVDHAVEADSGLEVAALFAREGEAGFRRRERAQLGRLLAGAGQVVATGGGAVLDPANREAMRARGHVVWLQVDVPTQLGRLAGDRSRPLLQRADREAALQALAAARTPLYAGLADLAFDTTGHDADSAAAALLDALPAAWRAPRPPRAACRLPPRAGSGT